MTVFLNYYARKFNCHSLTLISYIILYNTYFFGNEWMKLNWNWISQNVILREVESLSCYSVEFYCCGSCFPFLREYFILGRSCHDLYNLTWLCTKSPTYATHPTCISSPSPLHPPPKWIDPDTYNRSMKNKTYVSCDCLIVSSTLQCFHFSRNSGIFRNFWDFQG